MLATWLLAFCRLAPIAVLHPVFGARSVPRTVTVGLAAALSGAAVWRQHAVVLDGLHDFMWSGVKEIALGTAIGLLGQAVFGAIEAAGRLVDDARGANVAHLYAPQLEAVASPLGQMELSAALALFWGLGLHRQLVAGLFGGVDALPLGGGLHATGSLDELLEVAASLARTSFALAGPAAASCVLVDAAMGLVNRAAPSANVFLLGQPVKLAAAVLVSAAGAPARVVGWSELWRDQNTWLHRLLGL